MNAEQAWEKALKITSEKERSQYISIKEDIEIEVDKGYMETRFYNSLMPSVEIALKSEGFKVSEFFDQKDGTTITIKW